MDLWMLIVVASSAALMAYMLLLLWRIRRLPDNHPERPGIAGRFARVAGVVMGGNALVVLLYAGIEDSWLLGLFALALGLFTAFFFGWARAMDPLRRRRRSATRRSGT